MLVFRKYGRHYIKSTILSCAGLSDRKYSAGAKLYVCGYIPDYSSAVFESLVIFMAVIYISKMSVEWIRISICFMQSTHAFLDVV